MIVEVCVDSLESALAAEQGGADRVELCSSLVEGGLTPSHGLVSAVCRALARCRVHVLVRPRPGDFLYSQQELQVMRADVLHAASCGAHGVVLGMLTPDGQADAHALRPFVELCSALGLDLTFHRAFDLVRDQRQALDDLVACRVRRVLSSGDPPTLPTGSLAATVAAAPPAWQRPWQLRRPPRKHGAERHAVLWPASPAARLSWGRPSPHSGARLGLQVAACKEAGSTEGLCCL